MLLAYLAISRTICQSFRCKSYDGGDEYDRPDLLTADLSISCTSPRYWAMVVYADLSLLVYSIGIPLALFFKLYKWRRELNPPKYEDEERAIKARLKTMRKSKAMRADPIVELALPYRPRYWWYEVFSLGRRFALTSIVLAFRHWHGATAYTVLVLVSVHILEREWSPMINPLASNFSHGLSWQIVMSVIYMLFLDAGVLDGTDAVWYSVGLFAFNVGLMGVIGKAALAGIEELKRMVEQLQVLNAQLMQDKLEDKEEFRQAWDKLIEEGDEGDEQRMLRALETFTLKSALPDGKQPTPKQDHRLENVDELMEQAEEFEEDFHDFFRTLVQLCHGEYLRGPTKSRARALEKIEGDYGGNHLLLVDAVRSSAIFDSFAQLTNFVGAFEKYPQVIVVRAKDRFNKPLDSGYRDMLLNVMLDGGEHVCELQLHLKPIIAIKPAAHRTYALMRSVGWEDDSVEEEEEEEENPLGREAAAASFASTISGRATVEMTSIGGGNMQFTQANPFHAADEARGIDGHTSRMVKEVRLEGMGRRATAADWAARMWARGSVDTGSRSSSVTEILDVHQLDDLEQPSTPNRSNVKFDEGPVASSSAPSVLPRSSGGGAEVLRASDLGPSGSGQHRTSEMSIHDKSTNHML